jgi:hypothetical protein
MKKSGKGRQEWQKACEVVGVPSHKFNTSIKLVQIASRVILFQEIFELKHVIVLCYGKQQ